MKTFLGALLLLAFVYGDGSAAKSIGNDLNRHGLLVADHFLTVENLRVHYLETGKGPTVVLIHGNAGSVADFEFGALDLLSTEYRVVAVDRPGHGSSDRPVGKLATVERQAELLHRTLTGLGITQPVLVGHSWGGSLALAYVLKYPGEVSAMVLLAPAAYPEESSNGFIRAVIRTPIISDLGISAGKVSIGRRMLRKALAQAFYPQPMPKDYLKLACSSWLRRKQLKAYIEDESSLNYSLKKMSRRYSEIDVPVVIVTGDSDKIVLPDQNARALHLAIPQSSLIELKDTGHEIPLTRPESIAMALKMVSALTRKPVQTSNYINDEFLCARMH